MLRRLLAALVVPALLLAGCASPSEEVAPAAAPSPVVFTDPSDRGNASMADGAPHLHDYWNGAETLVVMDGVFGTGALRSYDYTAFNFRPDAGGIVPQGTHHVEVTMSWTDDPYSVYERPELWVKTAADSEPWLAGPVEQGVPILVESTNARNDLPHQSLSAWVFQLRLHPTEDVFGLVWFENDVQVTARAHRGLEIPLYPAHPDPWKGADELPLFEVQEDAFFASGNPDEGTMCLFGCLAIVIPQDGAIVPSTGALVEVTLTMGPDAAGQLGLSFHGADSRAFTRLAPDATEGKTRTYLIPIAAGMGDGPYAQQSQWEFRAFIEGPVPDAAHLGSYSMSARVLKDA